MSTRLQDYTVGWICALAKEYVVACELLDEEYSKGQIPRINTSRDHNIYTFGRIHEHHVVIACLPDGRYGLTSAAIVAERMQWTFPALRFGLMVGIAGAAPSLKHDIRLGDIVVSSPTPRHGGVVQYDFGKAIQEHEFEEIGHLPSPPEILLSALSKIKAQYKRKGHRIDEVVEQWLQKTPQLRDEYSRPGGPDKLYKTSYIHSNPCECERAETSKLVVPRKERTDGIHIHHGLVASANSLMKNALIRDTLIKHHDVLCFEMEAAGLMHSFPCLVIRGICDYSDTHKNDAWQGYAAAVAAAYAKDLLGVIPGDQNEMNSSGGTMTMHSTTMTHQEPKDTKRYPDFTFSVPHPVVSSESASTVLSNNETCQELKNAKERLSVVSSNQTQVIETNTSGRNGNINKVNQESQAMSDIYEDEPDLFGALAKPQSHPPNEDMWPKDPDMEPQELDLRFEGDLYTPRLVRGHGNTRQGFCGFCKPGRWLVLKSSAYWYDKSFTHGINAATGRPFDAPKETRRMSGNPNVWEGLCATCDEWITLISNKKKGSTWFRHAYKCHNHHMSKVPPNKRLNSSSVSGSSALT